MPSDGSEGSGDVLDLFGVGEEEGGAEGMPSQRRRGPNNPLPKVGQRFSHWTLVQCLTGRPIKRTWQCDCGKVEVYLGSNIIGGNRRSCGCQSGRDDLTGKKVNHLTVLNAAYQQVGNVVSCLCLCDCGKECVVSRSSLTRGRKVISCGCLSLRVLHPVGTVFGSWTTLEPITKGQKGQGGRNKGTRCVCTCGISRTVRTYMMLSGKATNCGCLSKTIPDSGAAWNVLWKSYLRSAGKRGIPFTLSHERFKQVVLGCCAYCGSEPSNSTWAPGKWGGPVTYNGIDRKNSTGGYDELNIETCCRRCNSMKRTLPLSVFLTWANRVANKVSDPLIASPLTPKQAQGLAKEYRHSARRRGLDFDLTTSEVAGLCGGLCHYCASPPDRIKATPSETFKTHGIDRIDNEAPYVPTNCATACSICNYAKSDLTVEDFLAHVRKIAARQALKPVAPIEEESRNPDQGSGLRSPRAYQQLSTSTK